MDVSVADDATTDNSESCTGVVGFEFTGLDDFGDDERGDDVKDGAADVMATTFSFVERLGTTDGAGDIQVTEAESAKVEPLHGAVDVSLPPDNEDVTVTDAEVDAVAAAAARAALLISLASATDVM